MLKATAAHGSIELGGCLPHEQGGRLHQHAQELLDDAGLRVAVRDGTLGVVAEEQLRELHYRLGVDADVVHNVKLPPHIVQIMDLRGGERSVECLVQVRHRADRIAGVLILQERFDRLAIDVVDDPREANLEARVAQPLHVPQVSSCSSPWHWRSPCSSAAHVKAAQQVGNRRPALVGLAGGGHEQLPQPLPEDLATTSLEGGDALIPLALAGRHPCR